MPHLCALENDVFPSDRLSRNRFLYFIKTPERTPLIVAKENNEFLGYILVFFRKNSLWARAYSLAVIKNAQGKGVGKKLMEAAFKEAQKKGCLGLRLEVREADTHVVNFYHKLGFQTKQHIAHYYEDGAHALRLQYTFNQ